jgi:predicted extracellular nuclease
LDYLLVYPQPGLAAIQVTPFHVNADYPYMYMAITDSVHRSSDHDPLRAQFELLQQLVYLPLTMR